MAVYNAQVNHQLDDRLVIGAAAPSTYGSEGSGADGAFLIPPEFSTSMYDLALEGEALLPLTDDTPVNGNSMTFPADAEKSPAWSAKLICVPTLIRTSFAIT